MVADSVVVELGEYIMWILSEEGDEEPGKTVCEREGGSVGGYHGAEEDCYEEVWVGGVEGVGFDVWVLDRGEEEFWEFRRECDLGVEEGGGGFQEEGVF